MHAEIYKGGKRAAVVPPPKRKPRGHDLMEGCPLWVDHMGCWGSKACLPVGDPASWPLWPSEHRGTIGTPGRTFCDLVVRRQTTFKYCGFCGWVHHSCSASPHSGFKSYSHPCPIATVKLTPRRWSLGRLWPQSPHCCVPSGPLLPAKVMLGISLAEAGLPLCAWEKRPDFWQDSVVYLKSHQMSLWPKQLPSLQPEPKFCWFFFFFFLDASGNSNKHHHHENVGNGAKCEAGVQPWHWGLYTVFLSVFATQGFGTFSNLHLAVQSTLWMIQE